MNSAVPVNPIRDGYHTASPYLSVKRAATALDFYRRAFAAKEIRRLEMNDGTIAHAEIRIGDSIIMLADEFPSHQGLSPETLGGSSIALVLCVDDADTWFERAIAAGGKIERPLANQFSGDRSGTLLDPFGHRWIITSRVEELSDAETNRRFDQMIQSA